jgi:hypothetical protein
MECQDDVNGSIDLLVTNGAGHELDVLRPTQPPRNSLVTLSRPRFFVDPHQLNLESTPTSEVSVCRESEVGVSAPQVDNSQWSITWHPPGGSSVVQRSIEDPDEFFDLVVLVLLGCLDRAVLGGDAQLNQKRLPLVHQATLLTIMGTGLDTLDHFTSDKNLPGLGHPKPQLLLRRSDVPMAKGFGQQTVKRLLGLLTPAHIPGVRLLIVVLDHLQQVTRFELYRA